LVGGGGCLRLQLVDLLLLLLDLFFQLGLSAVVAGGQREGAEDEGGGAFHGFPYAVVAERGGISGAAAENQGRLKTLRVGETDFL